MLDADSKVDRVKEQLKNINLLIVDDCNEMREAVSDSFSQLGFTVFQAPDGNSAFDIIQTQSVHAVISDVKMPNGGGVDLLENIRRFDPKLPIVILMSGFADVSIEEAQKKGAFTLISKPIKRAHLIKAVINSVFSAYD